MIILHDCTFNVSKTQYSQSDLTTTPQVECIHKLF